MAQRTVIYRDREFIVDEGQFFDPAIADEHIERAAGGDTPRNAPTTLDGYQVRAFTTAAYPGRGEDQLIYPAIAMVEESGELAQVVLGLLRDRPDADRGNDIIAEGALATAAAFGSIMGMIKKAYRNEPAGQLTPERIGGLRAAIMRAQGNLTVLDAAIMVTPPVSFPSLPITLEDRDQLVKEAGDVLWYIADFCTEARVSLGYVGDVNYTKLADRARRGVIRSAGDDR